MIRDTETETAEKQQEESNGTQPDLVAQVLAFLLKECKQNNPDSRRECDHSAHACSCRAGGRRRPSDRSEAIAPISAVSSPQPTHTEDFHHD